MGRISLGCFFGLALMGMLVGRADAVEYKAGEGPSVKKWMTKEYNELRTSEMPVAIYLYVTPKGTNADAKTMEGAAFLGDAEVQESLRNFTLTKVNVTVKEDIPKSWLTGPGMDLIREGQSRRSVLVLYSNDFQTKFTFKKGQTTDPTVMEPTPTNLKQAVANIQAYQDKKKAFLERDKKPEVAEKDKAEKKDDKKVTMIAGLAEKDPKDEKKPAPTAKKVALPTDE